MGVINVTPDSFSDGGELVITGEVDYDLAASRGVAMVSAGADIIDVGGESTRPGSSDVPAAVEISRILPVVERLVDQDVVVSVDTSKAEVAAAALNSGAEIINDVTALKNAAMAQLVAESGCGVVLVHMQGNPRNMQRKPSYEDVVFDVAYELRDAAISAIDNGVEQDHICLDPGIGFGKTWAHSLRLLQSLGRITSLGYPVLVGASRKSFLGAILDAAGHPASAAERDPATMATVAVSVASGAAVVRVHDVSGGLQAARTTDAIVRRAVPVIEGL